MDRVFNSASSEFQTFAPAIFMLKMPKLILTDGIAVSREETKESQWLVKNLPLLTQFYRGKNHKLDERGKKLVHSVYWTSDDKAEMIQPSLKRAKTEELVKDTVRRF